MAPSPLSPASQLALLPPEPSAAFLASCTPEELAALEYDWPGLWARPNQLPPPEPWKVWLILSGGEVWQNGAGLSRSLRGTHPEATYCADGETAADCRDVVVEGESGLLACSPPWLTPTINPPSGADVAERQTPPRIRATPPSNCGAPSITMRGVMSWPSGGMPRKPGTISNSACGWGRIRR